VEDTQAAEAGAPLVGSHGGRIPAFHAVGREALNGPRLRNVMTQPE
jgi:hypothetical protein